MEPPRSYLGRGMLNKVLEAGVVSQMPIIMPDLHIMKRLSFMQVEKNKLPNTMAPHFSPET